MSAGENLLREIFQAPPVWRLQAAIEKLENLNAESTPGPWLLGDANGAEEPVYGALWVVTHEEVSHVRADQEPPEEWFLELRAGVQADADLIVTLHRTIDAQLEILRFAVKRLKAITTLTGLHLQAHEHEVALADAILGGDS